MGVASVRAGEGDSFDWKAIKRTSGWEPGPAEGPRQASATSIRPGGLWGGKYKRLADFRLALNGAVAQNVVMHAGVQWRARWSGSFASFLRH